MKAFSKDLFGSKKPASLKDVELNPQARSAPFLFFGKLKMIFLVFVAGSICSHEHQSEWAAE